MLLILHYVFINTILAIFAEAFEEGEMKQGRVRHAQIGHCSNNLDKNQRTKVSVIGVFDCIDELLFLLQ